MFELLLLICFNGWFLHLAKKVIYLVCTISNRSYFLDSARTYVLAELDFSLFGYYNQVFLQDSWYQNFFFVHRTFTQPHPHSKIPKLSKTFFLSQKCHQCYLENLCNFGLCLQAPYISEQLLIKCTFLSLLKAKIVILSFIA